MDQFRMERMQFYGRHGVFAEETSLGQRFYLDLWMTVDLQKAGQSDDLADTINYAQVYARTKEIVEKRTFKLIEALAETVAQALLSSYANIDAITVKVTKPHPPFEIFSDGISVVIEEKAGF